MKKNNLIRIFVFVFLIFITMQLAAAIGITPSRKFIDFSPGLKIKLPITIINAEQKDMRVLTYAQGELEPYITFEQTLIEFSKEENRKDFIIDIELPDEFEKAGNIQAQVFALEFPSELDVEENSRIITAKTAVASQIIVRVPYPGKYAEAGFYIEEGEAGQVTRFVIPIINLGTDNIASAKADITIYSPANKKIAELTTQEISLKSKRQADLKAGWTADVVPGFYFAVVVLDYDGKKIRFEKKFKVGERLLQLLGFTVSDFRLGEIAEFNAYVYNNWNEILNDVFAEMTVRDLKDRTYITSKSAEKNINPSAGESLQTYWNTEGISVGPYRIDLIVNYEQKKLEKTFDINVYPDEIQINSLTARAISQDNKLKKESVIVMSLIILAAINIGGFIIISKRLKRKTKTRINKETGILENEDESNK